MALAKSVTGISVPLLNLGSTERKIMRYLWSRSAGVAIGGVADAVNAEYLEDRAPTTYQTQLLRLVEKGMVTRDKPPKSKEFLYRAAVTKDDLIDWIMSELSDL